MNTLEIIESKEKEFQKVYDRMDKTRDLAYLKPYKLTRLDDSGVAIQDVVNVTINTPATIINSVVSAMYESHIQTVVEGTKNNRDMNDKETFGIESFLDAHFEQIDELLVQRDFPDLKLWVINQLCLRGKGGGVFWPYLEDGEYYPEFTPWDTRYMAYEYGRRCLDWGSNRSWRSASKIMAEYGAKAAKKDSSIIHPATYASGDKSIEVVCFVDGEWLETWIEKQLVRKLKNPWNRIPVVMQKVASGFMLRDEGYEEHEGEDLLQFNRDLFGEQNRNASIEATLGMKLIMPGQVFHSRTPNEGQPPKNPDAVAALTEIGIDEKYELAPMPDLNRAAQIGHANINNAIMQGGQSAGDRGDVNLPAAAVAIAAQSEIRNRFQAPRLLALAGFMQQLSEMSIDFYSQLSAGNKLKTGRQGKAKVYPLTTFDGDYTVKYRYMTKSKEQEIANIAVYQATEGKLPLEVRIRDILQAENPGEIIAELQAEKAEMADPVIALMRIGLACIDEADELEGVEKDAKLIEAQLLQKRIIQVLQSRNTPAPQELNLTPQKGNSQLLMPLLGAGNMGGAGRAAQGSTA